MKMQKTFFVILLVALLSTFMIAQSSSAKITGKVVTADGTAIPGVMITATSPKMVGKAIAISDENGIYRLMNLRPGTYNLKYELEGFATMINSKVSLSLEQTLRIPVTMELKRLEETIEVKGQAPLIDVKSASQGMNLSRETFDSLPKGRDFTSLVTAIPGVSDEPMLSGISVDGASGAENQFYIDGVNVTNLRDGEQAQSAAFDFIEEVQIKASGYMAEFGGSLGGVVSAITRSGGNQFHGDVVGYYSGNALRGSERTKLELDRDDTSRLKYYTRDELWGDQRTDVQLEGGFNFGGYLLKDKVWFYGSFMPKFWKDTNNVTYPDSGNTIMHTTKRTWMNYMVKLSTQILSNVRFSGTLLNNFNKRRGARLTFLGDYEDWGPLGNEDRDYDGEGFDFPNYSASGNLDITLGNNSMLNIKVGMFFMDTTNPQAPIPSVPLYMFFTGGQQGYADTSNSVFPEIPDQYRQNAGFMSYSYTGARQLVMNIAEHKTAGIDYTLYFNLAGEHSLKAGFQFVRQGEEVNRAYQQPKVYLGWDLNCMIDGAVLGRGTYGYYAVRGNDATGPHGDEYKAYSNRMSFYVQDSWTLAEKLTLNFGLRAESEYIPSYSNDPLYADAKPVDFDFSDKLAPRVGFVYDAKGDSSLKVFGSYGLFFDVMKLGMAPGTYGGFKWKSAYYTLDTYEYTTIGVNGNYPGEYLGIYDFRPVSFETTDANLKPMSQQSISFGIENKMSEDISVGLRVVQKHLRYAIEDVGVMTDHGEEYYTANPGYGWSLTEASGGKFDNSYPDTPKAKREYWGVTLNLDKRFSNNWMGGASYTWSRLTGNYSGLATSDEPGRNSPNTARFFDTWYLAFNKYLDPINGPLATDRTHQFKAYGSYIFPFGLTIGSVINGMSGTPVSEEWVMSADGYLPEGRANLGRTPFLFNMDVYAEYNLKLGKANLQFSVNVTNVLNLNTAQRVFQIRNQGQLAITGTDIISGNVNYPSDATPDPRYMQEFNFKAPLSARIGLKLSF